MTTARADPALGHAPAAMREHLYGLDLVRCMAIGLVLACHCGLAFTAWFMVRRPVCLTELGYLGVEIFFVLSGYLIGGIMLDILASSAMPREWRIFVVRRWFRTLPLYFVWLLVLAIAWPPGLLHDQRSLLLRILPSYLTLSQNLAWPQPDWFTVSWSLSIEEWFYILFPLTLALIARTTASRAITLSVGLFVGLPLLLRLVQPVDANWNEYLHKAVVFRLDGIAFGVGAIAIARRRLISAPGMILAFATGAALLLIEFILATNGAALLDTRVGRAFRVDVTDIACALVVLALARLPRPPRWVDFPTRHFAAQSYATYITHYSILEWVGWGRYRYHWGSWTCCLLATATILTVPIAIWRGFEKPILALRPTLLTADGASRPARRAHALRAGRGRRSPPLL